jgi:hypothetical protein
LSVSSIASMTANFTGTIPEKFALLNVSLMDLFLNDNEFTGPVPVAFDHLTALGKFMDTMSLWKIKLFLLTLCCKIN